MEKSLLIFVNGYTRGCQPLKPYWTEKGLQFLDAAAAYFGASPDFEFVTGQGPWYSSAAMRMRKGYRFASENRVKFQNYDRLFLVGHSMGCAFAEGMALYFTQHRLQVCEIVHLSAADAESIRIPPETASIPRVQLEMQGDRTLIRKNKFKWKSERMISGVSHYGLLQTDVKRMHPQVSPKDHDRWDFHYDTKTFGVVWEYIRILKDMKPVRNADGTLVLPESDLVFLEFLWEGRALIQ